ncbi:hypothetical protein IG631_17502 [Alternaria alternata]|jgi:hypothetical protein|nr:hypothetical protein IG631_17502 [Alternaria alternata]
MNCGVALRSFSNDFSSTNWPMEYHRADLSRCGCCQHMLIDSLAHGLLTSSRSALAPSSDAMSLNKCSQSRVGVNWRSDATRRVQGGPIAGPR